MQADGLNHEYDGKASIRQREKRNKVISFLDGRAFSLHKSECIQIHTHTNIKVRTEFAVTIH